MPPLNWASHAGSDASIAATRVSHVLKSRRRSVGRTSIQVRWPGGGRRACINLPSVMTLRSASNSGLNSGISALVSEPGAGLRSALGRGRLSSWKPPGSHQPHTNAIPSRMPRAIRTHPVISPARGQNPRCDFAFSAVQTAAARVTPSTGKVHAVRTQRSRCLCGRSFTSGSISVTGGRLVCAKSGCDGRVARSGRERRMLSETALAR